MELNSLFIHFSLYLYSDLELRHEAKRVSVSYSIGWRSKEWRCGRGASTDTLYSDFDFIPNFTFDETMNKVGSKWNNMYFIFFR